MIAASLHGEAPFLAEVRERLTVARAALDEFLALPAGASVEEHVRGFDRIAQVLDVVTGPAHVHAAAHPVPAVRDAAELALQELAAFATEVSLHRGAFERLRDLDLASADPGQRRFVEHALRDYRRSGVDKDDATRERIRALQSELVEIGQRFDRNIVEGNRELRLARGHAELAGLPADFLAAHPEAPDGSVTLATEPAVFQPVMLYAEDDEVRRRLLVLNQNRAHPANLPVLDELLAKRHELATLLGFPHWAEWVTGDKMVGDAASARAFVERIAALARPRAESEYGELLALKRRTQPGATKVHAWESAYLSERLKELRFAFDSKSVRPYFAYENVERGVLATTAALFGVEIRRVEDPDAWHADVRSFEVVDGGAVVARFFLDMFPREGKYKHAAMFDWRRGTSRGEVPAAVLLCNFARPSAGDPALLMHDDVTTFFHELGHLMHHLFARQRYFAFSGIACEWDFVEVPSQLYEEWAWNTEVLQSFALHHETGEPIPAELVDRMRSADEYGKGLHVTSQMVFATIALDLFDRDPTGLDTTAVVERVRRELSLFEPLPDTHMQASFGHLHGYSAAYYTYMWSLVIAKDLWGAFGDRPMDAGTAARYRREVLAQGGAADARDLVRAFIGRDYSFDAFEAWLAR